jgi:hypothetical protein
MKFIPNIFRILTIVFILSATLFAQNFTKITTGPVVNDGGSSAGCSWGDYDHDGDLDLFVANSGPSPGENNFLYQNNGNGSFTKITSGAIVNDVRRSFSNNWGIVVSDSGRSVGCSWVDYDSDGDLDLFVGNVGTQGEENSLYRNDGNGSFTKITNSIVVSDSGRSVGCSWVDYDNDGDLDLWVDNENRNNDLYMNDGTGSFVKITTGAIVSDSGASIGSSWGDYDHDGDLDLFVPNQGGENNFLYRNEGSGAFTRITSGGIVNDGGDSKACSWADIDNDGDLDLFVANADPSPGENNFLYRNEGNGTFTKITTGDIVNDAGTSRGNGWADIDNDGDLDLFVANGGFGGGGEKNFLYLNEGDGTFTRILTNAIVSDSGRSIGSSWGDYDHDGDLDLFVANLGGENNFLYQNDGNSNHWINILCVGTVSNTTAIGAKVWVKATISGTPVWQLQDIAGQRGYGSQNSLNAEFGLGDATIIDSLKIEWPSGIIETYTNITIDQFITATENGGITGIDEKSINIPNQFELRQNYPNPFNPATTIRYTLPKTQFVTLKVYDILGREVTTLVNERQPAGSYSILFDASQIPSGLYFYKITAGNPSTGLGQGFSKTRKMVVMK